MPGIPVGRQWFGPASNKNDCRFTAQIECAAACGCPPGGIQSNTAFAQPASSAGRGLAVSVGCCCWARWWDACSSLPAHRRAELHMARILITSGPTRQYLDPVRYLTNASSGRMGAALAAAANERGHEVIVVSGPVGVEYPPGAEVRWIVSTEEMLAACQELFPTCDGVIGAAAPCDYRPVRVEQQKITKTGQPLELHLVETPDVIATLGATKRVGQWLVGFALET